MKLAYYADYSSSAKMFYKENDTNELKALTQTLSGFTIK
jgi:hypothetical protein